MAERKKYPSDLTDTEWEYIRHKVPAVKPGGRPAKHLRREIINGILYVIRAGCGWSMIPHDLPAAKTCYHYFRLWSEQGLWQAIHDEVRGFVRTQAGKKNDPALRLSTRRVLRQLSNPEFVAMMLERKSLEENDMCW